MSSDPAQSGYLLLFRGTEWHRNLPPEEIRRVMTGWMEWFDRLVAEGRCKGGHSLEPSGKVVGGAAGGVSDGPFNEAKEAVAGYFLLSVGSEKEAVEIAKECPGLPHGIAVEVRPLLERCHAAKVLEALERAAGET